MALAKTLGGVAALVVCAALAPTQRAAEWPSWPLQMMPGPDGDPRQDRTTFPKSRTPAEAPRKRALVPRPPLTDAGDGDLVLSGGWKLQECRKVAATIRELSTPGYSAGLLVRRHRARHGSRRVRGPGGLPGADVRPRRHGHPRVPEPRGLLVPHRVRAAGRRRGRPDGHPHLPGRPLRGRGLAQRHPAGAECGGSFRPRVFDVTPLVRAGQPNALAVRVSPVPTPGIPHEESLAAGAGPNGGAMLFDGPTFFCTEGWDWIPGIRDHVSGRVAGRGPARGRAGAHRGRADRDRPAPAGPVERRRHDRRRAREPGGRAADERRARRDRGRDVRKEGPPRGRREGHGPLAPAELPQLRIRNPRLWWPNGYGRPELYRLALSVLDPAGGVSDRRTERFGVPQQPALGPGREGRAAAVRALADPALPAGR